MKYKVIDYDVWGNKKEGFWVNQSFDTGIVIEVNPNDDSHIVSEVKRVLEMRRGLPTRNFIIDGMGQDEFSLFVEYSSRRFGYIPVCELQPV